MQTWRIGREGSEGRKGGGGSGGGTHPLRRAHRPPTGCISAARSPGPPQRSPQKAYPSGSTHA